MLVVVVEVVVGRGVAVVVAVVVDMDVVHVVVGSWVVDVVVGTGVVVVVVVLGVVVLVVLGSAVVVVVDGAIVVDIPQFTTSEYGPLQLYITVSVQFCGCGIQSRNLLRIFNNGIGGLTGHAVHASQFPHTPIS